MSNSLYNTSPVGPGSGGGGGGGLSFGKTVFLVENVTAPVQLWMKPNSPSSFPSESPIRTSESVPIELIGGLITFDGEGSVFGGTNLTFTVYRSTPPTTSTLLLTKLVGPTTATRFTQDPQGNPRTESFLLITAAELGDSLAADESLSVHLNTATTNIGSAEIHFKIYWKTALIS